MAKSLFSLPPRSTRAGDSKLVSKAGKMVSAPTIKVTGGGGNTLITMIQTIVANVETHLGKYADQYICIRDEDILIDYFDHIVANKYNAYDTETNSKNPMLCILAGVCLYTPGMKPAYVPMHHVSYVTGAEVANQLSDDVVRKQLKRIEYGSGVYIDMFNAKFDERVSKHTLGLDIRADWDGYVGAKLLNENEDSFALKNLHDKYIPGGTGKGEGFTYRKLFENVPFTLIPINTAMLYAAGDGIKTKELNDFQRQYLDDPASEMCIKNELQGVSFVMKEEEMPLIPVTAEMEDRGIGVNLELQEKLSKKYHDLLVKHVNEFNRICEIYRSEIDTYKLKSNSVKLDDPINISSPKQLHALLYDIMKIPKPSEKKGKNKSAGGTGEEVLERIDHEIAKVILDYRGVEKLIGTYIDKMPDMINPNTGKIHCNFNQNGTKTGRYSSNEPNMQNIPAKNKDIRPMFIPSEGYVFIGADYSSQEPRITAQMSNDKRMMQAFIDNKQIYQEIASIAFGVPYDECAEFYPDGTKNPEGKIRRARAKAIVLGVCYGKGVPSIAAELGISVKLAQEIYDTIMREFPNLEQFMKDSEAMAMEKGYVTTLFGRKRRLPDIQLPKYEFTYTGGQRPDFDPLDFDNEEPEGPPKELVDRYLRRLNTTRSWVDRSKVIADAREAGLKIKDNGGFIAQAKRQCVNSRIQGSAGDQIKLAMILVHNDKILKDLDFHLVLQVHDELIGEAPRENALEAARRFKYLMEIAIKDYLSIPSVCDTEIMEYWSGPDITEELKKGA